MEGGYESRITSGNRRHREAWGLTQRPLAEKLGVESSHAAFIESGRRKPSLKLVARLGDVLGLDQQDLLIQAHPEAKELIAEAKPETRRKTSASWQRFIENKQILARYSVTHHDLRPLETLSFLGTVHSAKEFLAILTLIETFRLLNENRSVSRNSGVGSERVCDSERMSLSRVAVFLDE